LRTLKSSFIPISDGFNSAYVTLTKLRPLSCHEQSYGEIWPWNPPQIECVCVCVCYLEAFTSANASMEHFAVSSTKKP